ALVVLEDERFTRQVRRLAQDSEWKRETSERLLSDPNYALDLPGAEHAATRAAEVLSGQGKRVFEVGAAVKQSAYTVQHEAWSRDTITDRRQRLALIKKISATRYSAKSKEAAKDEAALSKGVAEAHSEHGVRFGGAAVSPTVARGVALAALAVMGRAHDA